MIRLIELVPESIREDPQVQAACESIDRQLLEINDDIPQVAFWPNLDQQVPPLLDVMMWEYHVDLHQMITDGRDLTNEEKRALIDKSIIWHQKKGTKWAVEQVLETAWRPGGAYVVEWFEYGGEPYRFRLMVEDATISPEVEERIWQAVMEVKNVRSWPDEFPFIYLKPSELDSVYWAGITMVGHYYVSEAPTELPPAIPDARDYELVPAVFGEEDLQSGFMELEIVLDSKAKSDVGPLTIPRELTMFGGDLIIDNSNAVASVMFRDITPGVAGRWGLIIVANNRNFVLRRFDENGAIIGPVFVISLTTGIVNFEYPFTVNGSPWLLEEQIKTLETMVGDVRRRIENLERN
jgi:hypothetical protein